MREKRTSLVVVGSKTRNAITITYDKDFNPRAHVECKDPDYREHLIDRARYMLKREQEEAERYPRMWV